MLSPRGLEHSSIEKEEDEGDDATDRHGPQSQRLSVIGRKRGAISGTEPDHDFGLGAVRGERA